MSVLVVLYLSNSDYYSTCLLLLSSLYTDPNVTIHHCQDSYNWMCLFVHAPVLLMNNCVECRFIVCIPLLQSSSHYANPGVKWLSCYFASLWKTILCVIVISSFVSVPKLYMDYWVYCWFIAFFCCSRPVIMPTLVTLTSLTQRKGRPSECSSYCLLIFSKESLHALHFFISCLSCLSYLSSAIQMGYATNVNQVDSKEIKPWYLRVQY